MICFRFPVLKEAAHPRTQGTIAENSYLNKILLFTHLQGELLRFQHPNSHLLSSLILIIQDRPASVTMLGLISLVFENVYHDWMTFQSFLSTIKHRYLNMNIPIPINIFF